MHIPTSSAVIPTLVPLHSLYISRMAGSPSPSETSRSMRSSERPVVSSSGVSHSLSARHFPLLQLLLMLFCFVLNASPPQFPFIMLISVIALADPETKMPFLLILKPPAPWDSVCTGIHVIRSCISANKTQN